ncbi:F-type H+-transporting ATPase subunit b [Devosia sp. UYZn731]|uniref:F0F1 ATP synthase subunit delta n=1 Tax=Devosia sp. UYZn731 TaxID=3156345 RepID=UPI00339547B9
MVIDWFTVGAQILNFLVLVWLLKRFLYQPVLDVIDKREKRIAASIADAAASKAQSATERDALQAKNDAFDKARAGLLAKAKQAADEEGKRLTEVARKSADALKEKQRRALASDAKALGVEISRRAEVEVFAIARKALADLADEKLEERMSALFIGKLGALKGTAKATINKMLGSPTDPATIRSAFDLPAKQHAAIQKAINDAFGSAVNLRFETAPELVSGIELVAGGQKLAWSISDYLKTLEKGVTELTKLKTSDAKGAA